MKIILKDLVEFLEDEQCTVQTDDWNDGYRECIVSIMKYAALISDIEITAKD